MRHSMPVWAQVLVSGSLVPGGPRVAAAATDGLVLHLDAAAVTPGPDEASDTRLAVWEDVSGQGHHVRQETLEKQPRLVPDAVNGLPVVHFSGNGFLDGPAVLDEGDGSFTIVAVWQRESTAAAQVICEQASAGVGRRASLLTVHDRYGFNGQNNDEHALLPYAAGSCTLSILTLAESGRVRLWHNDSRGGTGATGLISASVQNTGRAVFRVGAKVMGDGERLAGDIAEILIYDRVLEFEEVVALNAGLGAKWGIGKADGDGGRAVETVPYDAMNAGPDYTSRVPRATYPDTLPEQEAQLRRDPLLRRFARSRARLAADRYRPLYHYVNPEGSLNDPNGLCFWRGRWHLFYQAYPPEDPRQHWGHAVSDDLIHWRDLPYAIYPHPEEKCFSGAALVEEDRVIAMYHGTQAGNMIAVSSDPLLLNWEKISGKPVIPGRGADGSPLPYSVFDPCIWRQGGVYYSLSAGTLPAPGGKRLRGDFLLRSTDLVHWEYLHPFAEDDHYSLVGDDGACPYFWPIGDRHILLHFSHMSGGKYLLGHYDTDRNKFRVTDGGDFNFGAATPAGVHAPSAAPDGDGGVIVIFNMNSGKPTPGWNQIMTLPRRLTLTAPGQLGIEPAGNVESLRMDHQHVEALTLPANEEVVLDAVRGNAMEIVAEIDPMGAPMVEVNVFRAPDRSEYTRIAFYRDRGYSRGSRGGGHGRDSLISIDSSYSSLLPDVQSRAPETAPVALGPGEPLRLRIFIDRSVVEVFINGRQCVAMRIYPGREDSVGVSLRSQGRPAKLISLDAWKMRRTHPIAK